MDNLASSQEFRDWVGEVTGIDQLLYDPHYFGGGSHENLSGQSLDAHVDFTHHPITNWHRRLNLIVYLNHDWQRERGGNICFHKDPHLPPEQDEIIEVVPVFNRAVLFETHNHSWHGFKAVDLPEQESSRSRKSFALYFYTDDRANKVRPHSTIYVEEHIPPEITAVGHTLTAEQSQVIRNGLTRRDHHLSRLYNNITDLMGQLKDAREYIDHLKKFEVELEAVRSAPIAPVAQEAPAPEPVPERGAESDPAQAEDAEKTQLIADLEQVRMREHLLRKRLYDIENATLWKMTGPIRALINKMRK
ncbi:2OG-Fe(II) oxygenase [Gilvimarinus sp. SDUM040013]|uniref:2OG-Fe(II) oxygenase n=1 Tax=Gilvimarinus gilvus TaxID=3058038 RepID=A0ABU4S0M2_9GAMM|nr:2OG-Fe(II) oxygenase [Gilvimarinus sp. SDUM040013]MDO3388827.1 2OG-Fe(II) oxygenase [Gilvimarinus sp. SDUM040013]MDX6850580.1 2OG-Fe(II) oxygenase [Gilvimarinus sp. SDUM040013]